MENKTGQEEDVTTTTSPPVVVNDDDNKIKANDSPAAAAATTAAAPPRQSSVRNNRRSLRASLGNVRGSMSEMFRNARMSFLRSHGTSGATVINLRGTTGADFEGLAKIRRFTDGGGCCCGCLSQPKAQDRLLLIKGTFCFVFVSEESKAPQYAIHLAGLVAELQSQQQHGQFVVWLREGKLGDIAYEVHLAQENMAKELVETVQIQSALAVTQETRKKLGHGHLINQRASVKFAETVAKTKVQEQPDKLISRDEILDNMPAV